MMERNKKVNFYFFFSVVAAERFSISCHNFIKALDLFSKDFKTREEIINSYKEFLNDSERFKKEIKTICEKNNLKTISQQPSTEIEKISE